MKVHVLRVQRTQPSPSKRICLCDLFSLVDGPHGCVAQAPSDPSPLRQHDSPVPSYCTWLWLTITIFITCCLIERIEREHSSPDQGVQSEREKATRRRGDDERREEAQARFGIRSTQNSGILGRIHQLNTFLTDPCFDGAPKKRFPHVDG